MKNRWGVEIKPGDYERILAALIAALVLTACATKPVSAPVVAASCPALKSYTPAQEAALGSALALLPPDNPLVGAMTDYGALRAADRACLGLSAQ
jgi:hypothetical protein